ncbi:CDP-diacylglycerol--glycerol-3-phosphate 3-phosphatidyltransferase [Agathobaculum sp.]|uniref:CDP-diacylglycerol--glycerol-3-phosphate 3-phosphatidyltransferase n=1 Tax=Agathobaculum sp. TaxID=2048138 RepID=UPI002A7F2AA7|nr:CDP-diacylglycerol--glycerol-3-phosphate 3-phosphatidyltransferase [Agathobaculum sp.]MDY3618007.1 CDP-diacylglycerol--glycerol-3-phosphate 3-phosphatidyltransferase [Agathobaculum sp.]
MTTANKITIVRILMIPFFIWCAMQDTVAFQIAALALFCVASFTDFLDGYVARKYNQVTDFGKFVDPLADKLLVTAALLIFIEKGYFAAWMVFIILAREFIITSLRIVAANKGRVLAATWTGKVKTCVQIGGVILLFLSQIVFELTPQGAYSAPQPIWTGLIWWLAPWVVTLVTLYSGFDYLRKNWDLIKDGAVKEK